MIRPALTFALAALCASSALADTLVTNVNGMQVGANGQLEHFTGLLIGKDGKVRSLLTGAPPPKAFDRTINGGGKTLLPGLIDAHGHVMGLGFGALQLDLTGTQSVRDLQARLRDYAARETGSTWVLGRGWNQELWSEKRFPTAADLDAVVADRPVILERVDGHAVVVNSAAMKAAGISAATKDVAGGKVERDANGNPTGIFVDNAIPLVANQVPAPTAALRDQALAKAQEILLSYGLTATADMGTSVEDWDAMQRAGKAGKLNVRIMSYAGGVEPLQTITKPTPWLFADRLQMGGVKLYADGALGSRGAFLKQPYADKPDTRGNQLHSDAELRALADRAAAAGFQIAPHAIGGRRQCAGDRHL